METIASGRTAGIGLLVAEVRIGAAVKVVTVIVVVIGETAVVIITILKWYGHGQSQGHKAQFRFLADFTYFRKHLLQF